MHHDGLDKLRTDPQAGIERRHRLLKYHADAWSPDAPQRLARQAGDVRTREAHAAAGHPAVPPQMPKNRHGQRRFAASRFADQPDGLALPDRQRGANHCGQQTRPRAIRYGNIINFEQRRVFRDHSSATSSRSPSASKFRPSTSEDTAMQGNRTI